MVTESVEAPEGGKSFWQPTSDESRAQREVIKSYLAAGQPLILWSPPGQGKTKTIRAIANNLGYNLVIIIGARKEPTFLEGIPIVQRPTDDEIAAIDADDSLTPAQKAAAKRPRTVNALPDWFEYAIENPRTIIFWDEIGSIPEDVQAAMLSVIEEREIDGVKLPDEVRFIAAGNDIDQAANGQFLAPPFANRFGHFRFSLPDKDWVDGFRQNFGDEAEPRLLEELSRLSGYLHTNSAAISPAVSTSPEESGKAWASRRTWTKLAAVLAQTDPNDRVVRDAIITSLIGTEQGLAFKTWDAALNFPEFEVMLSWAKDDKHDFSQHERDKLYAMLAYMLNFVTKETFLDVSKFFTRCSEVDRSVGFVMITELTRKIRPLFQVELSELPKDVLTALGEMSATFKRGK